MAHILSKATLCSTLAIATALIAPRPAAAQFVGSVISETGANAHLLGNGTLQINVTSPQAVINWSATGTAVNAGGGPLVTFQNAGAVAEFQGNGSFAVLNRVFPTTANAAIKIDGTITTSIGGQSGGGTVFFYSPNGIVIGANAMIDVGSLGLTTLDMIDDGEGNWLTGFGGGTMTLNMQPSVAGGYVRIDTGATVGVYGQNNFIALVAPRIDVQGTIKTDGVAALVGAEAATMTIRDSGLWDIVVSEGTSATQGVSVNGAITRNSATVGTNHTAYLVSVAKNDAMTMLHFGAGTNLGFEIAGSAGVEGNTVVLSAGKNIVNGAIASGGSSDSSITLDGTNVSSNLVAGASNGIDINTWSGASVMGGNVTLTADTINVQATNNNLSIGAALTATASHEAISGNATGGTINVFATNGKTLSVGGATTLTANGTGGYAASGTAGTGTGGSIMVHAQSGGHVSLAGTLTAHAKGFGGNSGGGTGGSGYGGTINLVAGGAGSRVTAGLTELIADGQGGEMSCDSCSVTGGLGQGGFVYLTGASTSGTGITLGRTIMTAQGLGGSGNAAGGTGRGGTTSMSSGDGGNITFNGNFLTFADGIGGDASGSGNGGAAYGGSAGIGSYGAAGGTITINGTGAAVHVTAEGFGGDAGTAGGNGGYAEGGNAWINTPGVTINSVSRQIYVSAYGLGGAAIAGTGGNALGKNATIEVNGTMIAGGGTYVQAFGQGGNGLAGGNGTGGDAAINVGSGTLTSNAANLIYAYGVGGSASGAGAAGGIGDGGHAALRNTGSSTLSLGGTTLWGYGQGGAAALGTGGAGVGGEAEVFFSGGTTNFTSTLTLNGNATGGNGVTGGNATGGWSRIYGSAGIANFTGAVAVTALATGGAGTGGAGGNAFGGRARLNADGADYHLYSTLLLDSNVTGGAGTSGGSANGQYGSEMTAAIHANNGGSVIVDGTSTIRSNAIGGNALAGSGGNGGNATGGTAGVTSSGSATGNGSVDLARVNINADATGGNGGSGAAGMNGGNGGNALGGSAQLYITNSATGFNSIGADSAYVYAFGTGGNGGAGGNGTIGGTGGNGGSGTGGLLLALAGSGNGSLDLGRLWALGIGQGGSGGSGGSSSGGTGGAGGHGGYGEGGDSYIGSNSGVSTATTLGTVQIDELLAFNDSYGGNGGNGGIGTASPNGAGGNGGDANVSTHQIQARGGTVTIGTASITHDSKGGNGGTGGLVSGQGGDAYTANIFTVVTNRAGNSAAGGTLDVGSFFGRSTAHTSTGSVAGQSIAYGGHSLFVENSSAEFDSYSVAINATNGVFSESAADPIRILNGSVAVTNGFAVDTDNHMSVVLDDGTLTAGSVSLTAADFEYDAAYSPAEDRGTISAGTIGISSGGDIILDAELVSGGLLGLFASGLIDLGDLTAAGRIDAFAGSTITLGSIHSVNGGVFVGGGGSVETGAITAGGMINASSDTGSLSTGNLLGGGNVGAFAGTTVSLGSVTSNNGGISIGGGGAVSAGAMQAATWIDIYSDLGPITIASLVGDVLTPANLSAGGDIDIDGDGAVLFGNASSGGSIEIDSGSTIDAGNLTSSVEIFAEGEGAVTLGNLSAGLVNPGGPTEDGFSVGISSETSILVGDIAGAESVGFATLGNLTTGSISAGGDILAMVSGDMSFGPLTAGEGGRIFLADAQMFIDAGGGGEGEEDPEFDPELVFAATPLATGGSITIDGNVSGGSLQAAAGDDFSSGTINVSGLLYVEAGNDIATGDVQSGQSIELVAGDLNVESDGSILIGDVSSDGSISFAAAGSIGGNGDFTAGGSILIDAGTSIDLDDIDSGGSVGLFAGTSVNAGDIVAVGSVTAVGGSAVTLGDVIAGYVPLAQFQAFEAPVAIIAINSGAALTTGDLDATTEIQLAAAGALTTGAVNSGGAVIALADGAIDMGGSPTGGINALGLFYIGGTAIMEGAGTIGDDFSLEALDLGASNTSGGTVLIRGDINSGQVSSFSTGGFTGSGIVADGDLFVGSTEGSVSVGSVSSDGYTSLLAGGGSITTAAISSDGTIDLDASTTVSTGALTADDYIDVQAGTGITIAGATDSGAGLSLYSSSGPISVGTIRADHGVSIETAGTILGSTISAGEGISVWGNGGVTLTNLSSGIVDPGEVYWAGVDIGSAGNVSLGTIHAAGGVDLDSGGNLTVGNIQSNGNVTADIGGTGTFGSVTTNAEGDFSISGWSAPTLTGFTTQAVADSTGGSVQINGAVDAGEVHADIGGNFTTQGIEAYSVDAMVSGTATINGVWDVNYTTLYSNDIAIGASGGIDGYWISLYSTNATQTVVGGGFATSGYLLDGTEFGKLSATGIEIAGRGDASAALDMVIGDLTLSSDGEYSYHDFGVYNSDFADVGGVMRVVGDVTGTNFDGNDYVDFTAGRIEVDAATATIALQGPESTLAGVLSFNTERLHVAEASILDKLAVDLNYEYRDLELQTPTATAHTDGIIRASEIYVDLDISGGQQPDAVGTAEAAPYSVLFQNTGTLQTRAGFVANYAEIISPEGAAPGSIDLVVNGQLVTQDGTLTGADARDALMEEDDPARFTPDSTINGCGVGGGPCETIPPPPPPPPVYDPGPPIADQIVLFADVPVGDESFGNEEAIEDNEEEGGESSATSPIEPPAPLFDTRPLENEDETDEPVSGGGNPALIGTGVNPAGGQN